ncbi:MAG: universal stress protein [Ahrensia sp.]|nr:universal stress protein [Ahrensia sp.]
MYDHILIPTFMDDEERLKTAVESARMLLSDGGKITLLNVVEEVPMYVESYVPAEALAASVSEVRRVLEEVAATMGDDLNAYAVKGHAGRTILTQAEKLAADLIIISSHRPDLADYFLGSTASRVVRHAKCPVLVLR